MKSFKSLVSEVAQPKPEEEKRFKDQHTVDIAPHPTATEFQHKGTVKPKAKRIADQEGDANYDKAYAVKEETEELDEISRDLARRYIRKVADKTNTGELSTKEVMKRRPGVNLAGKKAYPGIAGEPKVRATESVDLEEDITKMSHGRLKFHMNSGVPHGSYTKDEMKKEKERRLKTDPMGYRSAKAGLSEAEELDEVSKATLGSYIKKANLSAMDHARKSGEYNNPDQPKNFSKAMDRMRGIKKATDKLVAKEEVEQLDELSPNTLHSYIKKAAGNMAGNAAVAAAQASSSMKKSSPDVKRKIKNRMTGITGASGRLADKANMAENWQEEIPMMMRQLEFIAYAAEEIMDYVDMAGDPEEWFQNKISGIHDSMLSMYAYAQGGRRAGYGFDESVEEELKGGQKKLDHNKNGKIDAHDFKLMRVKKMKEEVEELDEISQEKLRDYHAKAGADRQKAKAEVEKGMAAKKFTAGSVQKTTDAYKRFTKRGKGMTAAANKMSEEVEILDEAFKQGIVKLKDGSSVALKKEDADLLNQLFKDLSAANRSKMQEVAMKDKTGFEEILGFAREAL